MVLAWHSSPVDSSLLMQRQTIDLTPRLFQWSGWRPKTHSHCGINCKYSDRVAETCEACDRGRTCGDSSFLYYGDGVYADDA